MNQKHRGPPLWTMTIREGMVGTCNPYYMGYPYKGDWDAYIKWLKEHEMDFEVDYFCGRNGNEPK